MNGHELEPDRLRAAVRADPSAKQLRAVAGLCDDAADQAWNCADQLDRAKSPSTAQAWRACSDAADVLRALSSLCRRPFDIDRAVVLRRMVETALTAARECSTACAGISGDSIACTNVETMCSRCSYELRHLLAALVADDVDERSTAR